MSSIVLSICIPTFNRGKVLADCIKQIVLSPSPQIEIVVSDNNSIDETKKIVEKIGDPRIKYYRNDKNLGLDANMLKLVERATGDFIFFLSDEDHIELEAIPWILKAVKKKRNVTQILGTIGDKRSNNREIYIAYDDRILRPGYESLTEILFKSGYMSGIVLNRRILNLDHARKYIEFAYMHQILQAQAMIAGVTICTSQKFCYVGPIEGRDSGILTKGRPYYHPVSRVYQLKQRIELICSITDDARARKKLLSEQRRYAVLLLARTMATSFNSFREILPLFFSVNELPKYSPEFWANVIRRIPIEFVSGIGLTSLIAPDLRDYFARVL